MTTLALWSGPIPLKHMKLQTMLPAPEGEGWAGNGTYPKQFLIYNVTT